VVDDKYGQAVTAVIQARGDHEPSTEEIREFLRPMLSGYKLPRAITYVPEIPRSATGKANYPKAKELAVQATSGAGV
jgi:acyl-CoA synthetase (AMP-forming)/AMP-acid ligase II